MVCIKQTSKNETINNALVIGIPYFSNGGKEPATV